MQQSNHSQIGRLDLELWTRDDADAWNEAQLFPDSETGLDEDPLLDNDLWMSTDVGGYTVSIGGGGRLQLRL
ncbi:MAG: hypothetical protein GY719_29895 [bacterium]|nr:hypothetical protein [bacterium]